MMITNSTGGGRGDAAVNPPVIHVSRDFEPLEDAPEPLGLDGLVRKALDAGFPDAESGAARYLLSRVSYQHASAYFPLLDWDDAQGHTMRVVCYLMLLDQRFQGILMRNIGLVELRLRALYSTEMAARYGAFAHRVPSAFKTRGYDGFLREYGHILSGVGRSGGARARRDLRRYGDLPIWQAVEEMPLGMLSRLYSNTRNPRVRDEIALGFGTDQRHLESWLHALTYVRNRCAHFGQLLGTHLPVAPMEVEGASLCNRNPLYAAFVLMRLLRNDTVFADAALAYSSNLALDVIRLFETAGYGLLHSLKVPDDWRELLSGGQIDGVRLLPRNDGTFGRVNDGVEISVESSDRFVGKEDAWSLAEGRL